ncbi:MBL fold metallo-hydrolase [Silicimonas algicola]|uniref:Glyoxylase-like metal-dependent hydrolase (Beta-lactamase superfamily II) n=1 Tax=Silicimonas algicola TaxID=1826607 RepID=A0A316GS38_9RHOB|nr:MBL fold metallo-hydrolase [Silicimonas algicola]AZQ67753.1 MBL fold metallo-hydrolase [Silicimonas algicola]PWK57837.1 glyoxylase-like metal-dependent hydrolase (beta-lactamase superfamily II) [Silicimonas algicola]
MDDGGRRIRYPHAEPPGLGEVIEVAEGVLWARMPLPMALDHVNVYALDDGDAWTLVDTGLNSSACRSGWEALLSGPLAGKPVARIVVTHHHPDHVGLAGWLMARTGATLVTTRTAWLFARMLTLDVQERPSEAALEFWRAAGMPAAMLEARKAERPFNFADVVAPLPVGYTRISEGDVLTAAGRRWRVRIGHGHAPEHATLWSEDDDLVLGGDQLLPSISPNLSVYPTEPEGDPVGDWIASCNSFKTLTSEPHLILPGHKLPFTGLPTRLDQMIENHVSALHRLETALSSRPATAVESFVPVFKREITGGQFGLALGEAVAHCLHLWHQGRASRDRREDGAWVYRAGDQR